MPVEFARVAVEAKKTRNQVLAFLTPHLQESVDGFVNKLFKVQNYQFLIEPSVPTESLVQSIGSLTPFQPFYNFVRQILGEPRKGSRPAMSSAERQESEFLLK